MTLSIEQLRRRDLHRWTKDEYNECVERGGLRNERIYLFRGEFRDRPQHSHAHAISITEVATSLFETHSGRHETRVQLPLEVPGDSMPERDVLICTREQGERRPHPDGVLLPSNPVAGSRFPSFFD